MKKVKYYGCAHLAFRLLLLVGILLCKIRSATANCGEWSYDFCFEALESYLLASTSVQLRSISELIWAAGGEYGVVQQLIE